MPGSDRRPFVVLAVLAVGAVVVLGVGIGAGGQGGGPGGDGGWQARLSGLGPSSPLAAADLAPAGGTCAIGGAVVTVTASCTLAVPAVSGLFSFGAVTRRAALVAGPAPLTLVVTQQGHPARQDLGAGETVRFTVGRDGGSLVVTCRSADRQCSITVSREDA